MQQKVQLETAAIRREWVFSFLTLDVVRAFYDMMGIDPTFHAGLNLALRDATLATRTEIVQALLSGGPKPTLATFCRHVESLTGSAATAHLAWWLQHVFDAEQIHNAMDDWEQVFRHCQREGHEAWRQLPFPKDLSNESLKRFATSADRKEYYRRCDELEAHPLSDWDLHMYASQTYDFDDDLEGSWPNPMTKVFLTLAAYQQFQFWAWVLRVLTPEQQTRLREKALEIARTAELTFVKDLVHPSALDVGL